MQSLFRVFSQIILKVTAIYVVVSLLGILALAFLISRLGGGGDDDNSAVPTLENGETSTSGLQTPSTTATTVGVTGNGVVPAVTGELQADAVAAIVAAGLQPVVRTERNAADAGTVITQSPDGGTQMEPGDPVINDHLGDAYWRVGREREARFQWQRALTLEPEKDALTAIEQKLKQGLPEPASSPGRT